MKNNILPKKIAAIFVGALLMLSISCGNAASVNNKALPAKIPVSTFLTEKLFNQLFPQRNPFYTYQSFIQAVNQLGNIKVKVARRAVSVYQYTRTDKASGKTTVIRQDADWNENWARQKPDSVFVVDYGNFCSEKELAANKKELAAFFAHIAHETRHGENGKYNDGLMFIHENNTSLAYIAENDEYPPVAGKKYYGRGPLQLSYNGNYGNASDCIFGDKKILLNNPDLVETDAVTAFKTAIYFWMTPVTHKPSAHDVMIGKWQPGAADKANGRTPGFGMTINIVNGEVECNKGEDVYSMKDRIGFYQYFLTKLGVADTNCACSCGKMQAY